MSPSASPDHSTSSDDRQAACNQKDEANVWYSTREVPCNKNEDKADASKWKLKKNGVDRRPSIMVIFSNCHVFCNVGNIPKCRHNEWSKAADRAIDGIPAQLSRRRIWVVDFSRRSHHQCHKPDLDVQSRFVELGCLQFLTAYPSLALP